MGMFDRMGRVISSNFNALLDRVEDPKKSLEQTLQDMRAQIRAARQEVVRAVAAGKQLEKKTTELDTESERWGTRAELAVKHGDDDLAREALLQKRRIVSERDRAEALRGEQRAAALEMKAELERMEQKVKEVEARKGTLAAKMSQVKAGGGAESLGARGPSAFEEFRRMEDQIEAVETSVQAQRELDEVMGGGHGPGGMTRDEVEAKFRALETGQAPGPGAPARPDVEDELKAIKKRVRVE
ncbi:MAG TPA: PspA/IM30 family protein [Polyangiaceae bacterium]